MTKITYSEEEYKKAEAMTKPLVERVSFSSLKDYQGLNCYVDHSKERELLTSGKLQAEVIEAIKKMDSERPDYLELENIMDTKFINHQIAFALSEKYGWSTYNPIEDPIREYVRDFAIQLHYVKHPELLCPKYRKHLLRCAKYHIGL